MDTENAKVGLRIGVPGNLAGVPGVMLSKVATMNESEMHVVRAASCASISRIKDETCKKRIVSLYTFKNRFQACVTLRPKSKFDAPAGT